MANRIQQWNIWTILKGDHPSFFLIPVKYGEIPPCDFGDVFWSNCGWKDNRELHSSWPFCSDELKKNNNKNLKYPFPTDLPKALKRDSIYNIDVLF